MENFESLLRIKFQKLPCTAFIDILTCWSSILVVCEGGPDETFTCVTMRKAARSRFVNTCPSLTMSAFTSISDRITFVDVETFEGLKKSKFDISFIMFSKGLNNDPLNRNYFENI